MSLKHAAKRGLRTAFTKGVRWTGLSRACDRLSEPRMLILYGHCVDAPEYNRDLDADMKIRADLLRSLLRRLGQRYDLVTVGEGFARLQGGEPSRSMVALSMDDGYRDNLHVLLPLLRECGARATVFLEAGAVVDRTLPWLHALGWLDRNLGTSDVATKLTDRIPSAREHLSAVRSSNQLKRALKYHADRDERATALDHLVREAGGDPRAIVDGLYLSHDEARELASSDVIEIGGHTVSHPVLARLDAESQATEIDQGSIKLRSLLGDGVGRVFAYPYGRAWDFDAASAKAVHGSSHTCAVTTHAGVVNRDTDPFRLPRWPIHDAVHFDDLAAEASGSFQRLRGLGIDLVE